MANLTVSNSLSWPQVKVCVHCKGILPILCCEGRKVKQCHSTVHVMPFSCKNAVIIRIFGIIGDNPKVILLHYVNFVMLGLGY